MMKEIVIRDRFNAADHLPQRSVVGAAYRTIYQIGGDALGLRLDPEVIKRI